MKCTNPNCRNTDHELEAKYCHVCGQPLVAESNENASGEETPKDSVEEVPRRLFLVLRNDKYGFVNKYGKDVIKPRFDEAREFSEGFAAVRIQDKWGFVNLKGEMVIKPQFVATKDFSESMAAVFNHDAWGFINTKGKLVIANEYDEVGRFSEGMAPVFKHRRWGFINDKGERLIPLKYEEASSFKEGVARVVENHMHGFINKRDKYVVNPVFSFARDFSEGFAFVERDGREDYYAYINRRGSDKIFCRWEYAGNFHEGLACVKKGAEYGFIDLAGKEVITAQYDDAMGFSEGLVAVKVKNLWGYLDKNGKIVISPQFLQAGAFSDDCAIVRREGYETFDVIDRKGAVLCTHVIGDKKVPEKRSLHTGVVEKGRELFEERTERETRLFHHFLLSAVAIVSIIIDFCLYASDPFRYFEFHGWGWAFVPCVVYLAYAILRIVYIEEEKSDNNVFDQREFLFSFIPMAVFNVEAFFFNNGWSFAVLIPSLIIAIVLNYEFD